MNIFRKRVGQEKSEMKRTLNSMDLTLLGLGAMVGAGIFTLTGMGVALIAGPSLMISIIIAGVAVGLSALIFAEFASRVPSHGGPYGYIYATFGEFPAWIVGWLLAIEFFTTISIVAKSWSGYFKGLLHLQLPPLFNGPLGSTSGFSIDLIPVFVVAAVSIMIFLNARTVSHLNNTLVVLKFSALIIFVIAGLFYLEPANWSNFAPFGLGSLIGGQTGILPGASILFIAFIGYETVSTAVDEAENPRRNIPYGVISSLFVAVTLYVIVTLVLTGTVPYYKLNVTNSIAFALTYLGVEWAATYVSIIAIITLLSVALAMSYALSRLLYSMSRDGLLPKKLSKISTKHQIPVNSTLFIGSISLLIAGFVPMTILGQFLSLSTLLYLIILAFGLLKLRKDHGLPQANEFKTPMVPFLPVLSILINGFLIVHYHVRIWLLLVVLLGVATLLYFVYSYQHSKLEQNTK
ncbi:APC family permease [Lactococcus ileimucosae]|uniref:Amino acid permease n=1 Tax=Lactococcus ileimucosae TaxID=2941329 RepID=A0ABV4D486_9LACT